MDGCVVVGAVERIVEGEGLVPQILDVHCSASSKGMVFGNGSNDRRVFQALGGEVRRDMNAHPDRDIEVTGKKTVEQWAGRLLPHAQVNAGMLTSQRSKERLELVACARRQSDYQLARLTAAASLSGGIRVIGCPKSSPRGLEQGAAGIGELNPAGRARKELDAQLHLQPGDGRAQRLLGHVKPLCGAGEVQLLGNGHVVPQQTQLRLHSQRV